MTKPRDSKKTVTRKDIVYNAAEVTGIGRKDVDIVSRRMFELIGATLQNAAQVKLSGFATFEIRSRAERSGRNPRTGELFPVSARHTVVLLPSFKLTEKLQRRSKLFPIN